MTKTKINGEWVTTSSGEQIWTGTKAQLAAGLADGTIPEGAKVMVTNDYVEDPMAYIRKQNILSEPEWGFNISTDSNSPWEAPYDGYFAFGGTGGSFNIYIKKSDGTWGWYGLSAGRDGDDSIDVFPFMKGEEFYATSSLPNAWVRYYKERDYSGRE